MIVWRKDVTTEHKNAKIVLKWISAKAQALPAMYRDKIRKNM
jgi:hypothetical protein